MLSPWLLLALLLPTVVTPFPEDYLEDHLEMTNREQLPADTLEEYPERDNRELLAPADGGHNNLLAFLRQIEISRKVERRCESKGPGSPNQMCQPPPKQG